MRKLRFGAVLSLVHNDDAEATTMRMTMLVLAALVASLAGSSPAQDNKKVDPKAKQVVGPFEQLRGEDWVIRAPDKGAVGVYDGSLMLRNRGYLFIPREITKGVTVTCGWTWKDLTSDDPDSLYADHLLVLLRSSGKVTTKRAFESEDGLRVRIRANDGAVILEKAGPENATEALKQGKLKREEGRPALAADTAHSIIVTDDGKTVSVTVNGHEALKSVPYTLVRPGKMVGFGNREAVGFPHLSLIGDLTVDYQD